MGAQGKKIMTSRVPRHDGFNKWQIKDGYIVLMKKDGTIAKKFDKVGTKKQTKG